MPTATWVGGQTLTSSFTIGAQSYPYPVVKYKSVAQAGDTFAKAITRLPSPSIVDMEGATGITIDFNVAFWNLAPNNTGGYGAFASNLAGLMNATITTQPNSSTKGPNVAALPPGASDQFYILRLGGVGALDTGPVFLYNVNIVGTPQGHVFNGFQLYHTNGSVIGPGKTSGIPGNDGVPPGETFYGNGYHPKNSTWNDWEIDGTGGASGFFANGEATTITYNRCKAHNLSGGGYTYYQDNGWTFNFTDCESHDNGGAGFNFEQCGGSTINLVRPHVGNLPVDLIVDSTTGSAKVTITDPVFTDGRTDGKFHVVVHTVYSYGLPKPAPVTQLHGDVKLIVNGADRSADLLTINTSYIGSDGKTH